MGVPRLFQRKTPGMITDVQKSLTLISSYPPTDPAPSAPDHPQTKYCWMNRCLPKSPYTIRYSFCGVLVKVKLIEKIVGKLWIESIPYSDRFLSECVKNCKILLIFDRCKRALSRGLAVVSLCTKHLSYIFYMGSFCVRGAVFSERFDYFLFCTNV